MLFSSRNLKKSYAAGTAGCSATARVLCGIDLELDAGQITGIVGERGAGKTTLIRCVAGLARPDAGVLHWHATATRPRIVSLAPAAYPFDTTRDVVDRACDDAAADSDRVTDAIADLGLDSTLAAAQLALTTDERARLALAIGLASVHPLLLLDGTADAIAEVVRPRVRALLERHAAAGGAVLLVGRDREGVIGLATDARELRDGKLQPLGAPTESRLSARVAERGAASSIHRAPGARL